MLKQSMHRIGSKIDSNLIKEGQYKVENKLNVAWIDFLVRKFISIGLYNVDCVEVVIVQCTQQRKK